MMASTGSHDPFLQVQSDVLSQLNTSRHLFASYLRIRSSASSSTSPELIESRNELQSVLKDLQTDIEDLVETVKAVESDPYSFGLQIEEVQRRRKLVDEVGNEVMKMHDELMRTVQDAQGKGKAAAKGTYLPDPSTFDDEDDYATEFEQHRQQELMQEQDEAIDGVLQTMGNLRQQADVIGQVLGEDRQLLDEVDTMADRVGGKLETGIRRIGQVIKQNEDTWSSCCIGVLIAVLILLLVVLLVI